MARADYRRIFNGLDSAPPLEIADALGARELGDEDVTVDLVGAVMSLCRRVAELEQQVEALKR
jgi:hypothetical protein